MWAPAVSLQPPRGLWATWGSLRSLALSSHAASCPWACLPLSGQRVEGGVACSLPWAGEACMCPCLPAGSPLWCHSSPCARGQGGQRRLPGMCSVSWGWVCLPAFPPSADLAFLASASRCVLGLQMAGPTHPSPSPSQGPGACQVVRLPVTHSGSSSCPPGKAAEQLGGQGEVFPSSASELHG